MLKEKRKKTTKKIDSIVTGVIIGTAVASLFGLSQTKKGKQVTKEISQSSSNLAKKGYSLFGSFLVKILKIFKK